MSVIYLRQDCRIDRLKLDERLDLSRFESLCRTPAIGSVGSSAVDRTDLCAAAALLCVPFALVLLVWCLLPQAAPGVVELSAIEFWSQ